MTILNTTEIGQGYIVEQLESDNGIIFYRICKSGTCRYAEDHWMVMMYAESMGWLPPDKQITG